MSRTAALAPLSAGPAGRPLDLRTLLGSVDRWAWARIGVRADGSQFLRDGDRAWTTLPGTRGGFLVVKLAADDTYSIEIGRARRLEYRALAQRHGVMVGSIAAALDAVYEEAFG